MVGELITLPLRVTGKAARLWWRATDQAVSLGVGAAGYVIKRVTPGDSHSSEPAPRAWTPLASTPRPAPAAPPDPPESMAPAEPSPAAESSPAQPVSIPRGPKPQPVMPAQEPAHVSEEPELVEEFAEPGAEDGAGAEVHIREPWEGYRHMSAREVAARCSGASAAELAAVQLYESSNRGRQTILAAVARELRSSQHAPQSSGANGSGSQP